jgi:hypothetical protein
VADALKKMQGLQVEEKDGNRGEFTVLVDGQVVAEKRDSLPPVEEVLAAVRKAAPAKVST